MLFHVFDQVPDAFAGVVARTFVRDIPTGACNRIGRRAIGRQLQQLEAGMGSQPLLDFLRFMEFGVVDHAPEVVKEWRGRGAIERVEEFQEEACLLAVPHTMGDLSGGDVQGARQIAFLVGAGRQHFDLFPFGHPLIAELGQQMNVQLVGKEQRSPCAPLFERASNPRSRRYAIGIIVFGRNLRPLPFPADLMKPVTPGFHREGTPPAHLEFDC